MTYGVAAAGRLRAYCARRLEEPATATALARFLCRAVDCGAAESAEVSDLAGIPFAEFTDLTTGRVGSG